MGHAMERGGLPDASLRRHEEALRLLDPDQPSALQADVLRWEGTVLRDRGRASEAEPLYRRSLQIARDLGYETGVAHGLNCLAALAQRRGDIVTADDLLTNALMLAGKCGEMQLVTMIQTNLGIIADIRGDAAAALRYYRVALQSSESINDEQQIVRVLVNFSCLLVRQEQYDDAELVFSRGLALARARDDLLSEGMFEENRAEARLARGEIEEAYPSICRALEVAEQRRDDVRKAAALKLKGAYERLSGRPDLAVETLRYGLTLAAIGEDALLGGEILYQFGLALHARDDAKVAHEVWKAALDAFERIAAREWVARVHQRLSTGATGGYV